MKKTVAFSKNSVNVFFHILTQCNLSCRHCYINKEQHGNHMLDIETIKKWLRFYGERKEKANVIFLGGEPTLHPDLSQAIKESRKLKYNSVTLDTNGYLFHDILSKITPDDVDFISFSLDGATEITNDKIRGKGSYKTCTRGIKQAIQSGFNTSLIYTVSNLNIHELDQMPDLLNQLGIKRFFIQVLGIRGNSANEEQNMEQVTKEVWLEKIPEIARETAKNGITTTYPKVFLETDEPFECAGNVADNHFIFPNGRVYKCPLCEDYPIHSYEFSGDKLTETSKINESDLFRLDIQEGCVINKLIQPGNLSYTRQGKPSYQVACCLLKEEIEGY